MASALPQEVRYEGLHKPRKNSLMNAGGHGFSRAEQ
jgi:hypothetical protein